MTNQKTDTNISVSSLDRQKELEALILQWVQEKNILGPCEVIDVKIEIIRRPLIKVQISEIQVQSEYDKVSIHDIGLSVRAANCLQNANLLTVNAVRSKTFRDMLGYRNFGKRSIREIHEKFKSLGVPLNWFLE